jgi:hypothetical protein
MGGTARFLATGMLIVAAVSTVHGGQPCLEQPASTEAAAQAKQLGARVREELEKSQLSAAFIGRVGMDMSDYGLRYTHLAIAWRDHPRGRWYTFHLLNKCGTGESVLTEQALEDFFVVRLHEPEALIVAPSYPIQVKLHRAFFGTAATRLHERQYSLISHPFSTLYQNSNQWILEVAASALAAPGAVGTRKEAQTWLRHNDYVPSEIHVPRLRRFGAWLASPHVRFDDHSDEEGRSGQFVVVSVESILRFLERVDPGLVQTVVR